MARIERDLCTISLDTSGELLHRRGHKEAVNAAPMRETMASSSCANAASTERAGAGPDVRLRHLVIEAAEIAARLNPAAPDASPRTPRHLRRRGLGADARGERRAAAPNTASTAATAMRAPSR
jgi:hypothetical protein